MKKNRKLVCFSVIAIVLALVVGATVVAALSSQSAQNVLKYIAGNEEQQGFNYDANGDGEVNVLDAIVYMIDDATGGLYAESISVEGYDIAFNKNTTSYTVKLPSGRPQIPQVSATANNGESVEVTQAYIADGETTGTAYVKVTKGKNSKEYTVKFVRGAAEGFVLQYDDRYQFPYSGDYKYTVSGDAVSVDKSGLMTAKKLGTATITAKGADTKTLEVTVVKAQINLFLMTGQSNGQGCYDNVAMSGSGSVDISVGSVEYNYLQEVTKIGGEGRVYSYDVHPRGENESYIKKYINSSFNMTQNMYDLNTYPKQGHFASLGKTWYDATGEKVVFLQSAMSGAPIESWLNPDKYDEAGIYNNYNYWQTTSAAYEALTAKLAENYEIIRTVNFWCQGETAMTETHYVKANNNYVSTTDHTKFMTAEKYYNHFMNLHNDMKEAFDIDYSAIMMVRNREESSKPAKISSLVPAFFRLVNENEDILLGTRTFAEIATKYNTGALGSMYIDSGDLHYSQTGYNAHGKEAAENVIGYFYGKNATGVEIIEADGLTRIPNNTTKVMAVGQKYQIATLSVPHNSNEDVTLASDNTAVAEVTQFGVITTKAVGTAKITATSENGKVSTLIIDVREAEAVTLKYGWAFNGNLDSKTGENYVPNALTISKITADKDSYRFSSANTFFVSQKNNVTNSYESRYRAEFALEKGITLDSNSEWEFEWNGGGFANSTYVIMGQTVPESVVEADTVSSKSPMYRGYILLRTTTAEKSVKFVPQTGASVVFNVTDTITTEFENNSYKPFKLSYSNGTMTLSMYDNDAWTVISTQSNLGEFSATFTNLFGRFDGYGNYGFAGYMDDIDITINTTAPKED